MEKEEVVDEECEQSEINVIPVQLVETYNSVSLSSPTNSSNIVRGKYYKQTYRPAWEQMPDFKGWLRGVEGEPTRAYCTYCQKTLHAHRLSLLKHTCTIRHLKASQVFAAKKNMAQNMKHQSVQQVQDDGDLNQEELDENEAIIEYAEACEIDEEEHDTEHDDEDDGESFSTEMHHVQFPKSQSRQQSQTIHKAPISTHVIDSTKGTPVAGLQVSLYKLIDGRWTYINEGVTCPSGKCSHFLERADFTPGRYKLHFDVDRYFESKKQEYLYPFIEIVFDSNNYSDHYHIPILLGPFGYTTYRGS